MGTISSAAAEMPSLSVSQALDSTVHQGQEPPTPGSLTGDTGSLTSATIYEVSPLWGEPGVFQSLFLCPHTSAVRLGFNDHPCPLFRGGSESQKVYGGSGGDLLKVTELVTGVLGSRL